MWELCSTACGHVGHERPVRKPQCSPTHAPTLGFKANTDVGRSTPRLHGLRHLHDPAAQFCQSAGDGRAYQCAAVAMFAVPTLNWIIINYSWHWALGALSVVGILWALAWLILGREGPLCEQPATDGSTHSVPDGRCSRRQPSSVAARQPSAPIGPSRLVSPGSRRSSSRVWGSRSGTPDGSRYCPGYSARAFSCWPASFQLLLGRGASTRMARGFLGPAPLVAGGLILLLLGVVDGAGPRVALLVLGSGISGAIYVVCPAMRWR